VTRVELGSERFAMISFLDATSCSRQVGESFHFLEQLVPRRGDFDGLAWVLSQGWQELRIDEHFDAAGNARLSCDEARAFEG